MSDYSELKTAAEAATPGPWVSGGNWVSTTKGNSIADCPRGDEEFIAAANPSAVLALIADLEVSNNVGRALGETLGSVVESRDALVRVVDQLKAAVDEWQNLAERRAQRMTELAQAANAAQDQAHRSRMDLVDQVERCDQLKAENEALRKDAERYRWLRAQHWDSSAICCVVDPKLCTKLGAYCPSLELLDQAVDAGIAMSKEAPRV